MRKSVSAIFWACHVQNANERVLRQALCSYAISRLTRTACSFQEQKATDNVWFIICVKTLDSTALIRTLSANRTVHLSKQTTNALFRSRCTTLSAFAFICLSSAT